MMAIYTSLCPFFIILITNGYLTTVYNIRTLPSLYSIIPVGSVLLEGDERSLGDVRVGKFRRLFVFLGLIPRITAIRFPYNY